MAIVQRNLYLPGRDLTNLAQNVDLNRVGMDLTDISIAFGAPSVVTVAAGSMIECNGNIYVLTTDETFNMVAGHNYITFTDNPAPAFASAAAKGTYSALKGGFYQAGNLIRTLKWFIDQTNESYETWLYNTISLINNVEIPIFGYHYNGEPLYTEEISVTIAAGNLFGFSAHGITNAYTNDRLFDARARRDTGAAYNITEGTKYDRSIELIAWDDTNLYLYRAPNTNTYTYKVFIIYR